jgi:tetratricopeptide (TPR) repeat protein
VAAAARADSSREQGTTGVERGQQAVERFIDAFKSKRRDTAGIHALAAMESFFAITDEAQQLDELRSLFVILKKGGLEDLALIVLERVVALQQALGNHVGVSSALIEIGGLYTTLENYDAAQRYGQRALDAALKQGSYADAAAASTNLASLDMRRSDYRAALQRLRHSLELLSTAESEHTDFVTRMHLVQVLDELDSDSKEVFEVARPLFGRLARLLGQVRSPLVQILERRAQRHHGKHGNGKLSECKAALLPELWGTK